MNTRSATPSRNRKTRSGRAAAMAAILIYTACGSAAASMEVPGANAAGTSTLDAADHAELSADISMSGVVRIALPGDRIARAIRAPGGPRVEHDPASGDLYLHPAGDGVDEAGPSVLFIGTERGFTYRLALTPAPRGASQILIRNPAVTASASSSGRTVEGTSVSESGGRVGALVRLVRAAARGERLAGHHIHAGEAVAGARVAGLTVIETWRGPRFTAVVFEAGPSAFEGARDAADLAGTIGAPPGAGPLAALWLAAPGTGPSGGRLAVAVHEDAPVADPRRAGGSR